MGNVACGRDLGGSARTGTAISREDDSAGIDAVLWRGQAARLQFAPEDGAEVIASGKLTTYPGRSKYQLVVERLELAGEGALMALLDKRRRSLAAEGLFDEAKKRPLPFLPRTIGIVTSPTGAVIREFAPSADAARSCPAVSVRPGRAAADKWGRRSAIRVDDRPNLSTSPGAAAPRGVWAVTEEEVVRAAAESPIRCVRRWT